MKLRLIVLLVAAAALLSGIQLSAHHSFTSMERTKKEKPYGSPLNGVEADNLAARE